MLKKLCAAFLAVFLMMGTAGILTAQEEPEPAGQTDAAETVEQAEEAEGEAADAEAEAEPEEETGDGEEETGDGEEEGVTCTNSLSTTLAYYGGAAFEFKEDYNLSVKIPFGGTGMLTQGNNMTVAFKTGLSPVAVTPGIDITITPLAILQFMAGGEIGSGWYFGPLGVNGVGVLRDKKDDNNYSKAPFKGVKMKGKVGGAFQFDTGAVIPGDWSHVVMRTYQEAFYQRLSCANNKEFWEYETGKDNRNGWKYYANYLLGYSTPAAPVLDMVGYLYEVETYLTDRGDSRTGRGGWGSDFWSMKMAALINMNFTESHGLATLVQFHRFPNYTQKKVYETDLPDRTIHDNKAAHWGFYRVAFVYTFSF